MNHKHIMVMIEALNYSGEFDTESVINDLIDYVEAVEKGETEKHYERCIAK